MALERRQFIGLTTQEAAQFEGLDRELTVDTTNGTLRVHTEDSPHGNRLAKYSELDAVNSLMLSEFDSVRGQINEVDDELNNSLATETSARENADATLSSSIGTNTTAIDGLTTSVASINTRLATVETALPNKQDQLVSGTNIKTLNNLSLLGSGNIDIQGGGGGEQTAVVCITVPVDPNNQPWEESHELSSAASECRFTVTSSLLDPNKHYLPIVLFQGGDVDSSEQLKPYCTGWMNSSNGRYTVSVFSGIPTRTDPDDPTIVYKPTIWRSFKLVLIEQTSGDSLENVSGLTNAAAPYDIVLADELPAEPRYTTVYLIPEQQE